jgi:TolB-like protein/Flp pilus assembly protein TadD
MFTDMVGYTALGQRNESLSLAMVEEHRRVIRPILGRHSGREVKTIGDAFLVEFPSAVDAIRCAYDIQRSIREFNLSLSPENRIQLRIGVHVGEVVESDGDISGDAVNVASRIEPLAEEGGVCISRQAYDHVQRKVDFHMTSLGSKTLKNVVEPLEVFRMVMPWRDEQIQAPANLDRRRIAVLPFENMSPDPNDSYFADGITEEIISTVSGIAGLRVISRTSVMHYRNASKSLKEIGRELEVGSVLEGSFRKAGNRIRITAQLIDVTTDEHLWTQSYDREMDDVFLIQTDVANHVADSLRVKILPQEQSNVNKIPTQSPEAHSLYLKGRYLWNKRNKESLFEALELFKKAVQVDQKYALAYSGIADCYTVLGDGHYLPYKEAFSKSKDYASRAVELDSSSPEAHTSLGQAVFYADRDSRAGASEFEKAIELSPSYATAYQWYGANLMRMGRLGECLDNGMMAQRLDPLSPQITSFVGLCQAYLGNYDLAEQQQFKALELQTDFVNAIYNLRYIYLMGKKYAQAEALVREHWRETEEVGNKFFLAALYALAGREAEAKKAMAEAETQPSPGNFYRNYMVIYYAALGDLKKAAELVRQEYDADADWLGEIAIDPLFTPIRSDPEVKAILSKVGVSA